MLKSASQPLYLGILMMAGLMGTYTVPVLIGFYTDGLNFSEAGAGNLGTIEILAIALAAIVASCFVEQWPTKKIAVIAITCLFLGQLLSAFVDQYLYLSLLRALVGASSGVLLAIVNSVIAQSNSPESLYGKTLAYNSLGFAMLLLVLPHIFRMGNQIGLFSFLALMGALSIFAFRGLQSERKVTTAINYRDVVPIDFKRVFLFFFAITALYIVTGGTWAFTERVAKNIGIESETVGVLLGLSTVLGILGAATAAALNIKLGRTFPTVLGFFVSGISCLLIAVANSAFVFTLGVLIYGFTYMFTVSYVLSIGAALDRKGRVAVATNGYLLIPYSFGPALYGFVGSDSLQWMGYAAFVVCVVSALLITLITSNLTEKCVEDLA